VKEGRERSKECIVVKQAFGPVVLGWKVSTKVNGKKRGRTSRIVITDGLSIQTDE
jgi:hypothetical protein